MEAMALSGLLGFLGQPIRNLQRKKSASDGKYITGKALENLREQKRLVDDAAKTQRMLSVSLNLAMQNAAKELNMPDGCSIDFETGQVVGPSND